MPPRTGNGAQGGKHWGAPVKTDETSLVGQALTSCRAAQFLTGDPWSRAILLALLESLATSKNNSEVARRLLPKNQGLPQAALTHLRPPPHEAHLLPLPGLLGSTEFSL